MIADERTQYCLISRIHEIADRSDCGLMIITLDRSLTSLLHHHPDVKYEVNVAKNPFLVTSVMEKENQSNLQHQSLAKKLKEGSFQLS